MLLVSDANIFIDFEAADLAQLLFKLPHEIVVPDVLYEQELAGRHAHLITFGLKRVTLTGEQVSQAQELQTKYKEPSINDLFALTLAKGLECPLATGDRRLRAAAESEGLQLLGTLPLMEQLVSHSLASLESIEAAYDQMKARGRRLPWKDVDLQLERLRGSTAPGCSGDPLASD